MAYNFNPFTGTLDDVGLGATGFVTLATDQTISGAKTLSRGLIINEPSTELGLTINYVGGDQITDLLQIIDSDTATVTVSVSPSGELFALYYKVGTNATTAYANLSSAATAVRNVIIPDCTGTLVSTGAIIGGAYFTMAGKYKIKTDPAGANLVLYDSTSATKLATFDLTPITAGNTRVNSFKDVSGSMVIGGYYAVASGGAGLAGVLGNVALASQTASYAAGKLGNAVPAGLYRLVWYVVVTASVAGILTPTVAWNDGVSARSITGTATSGNNYVTGSQVLYSAAGQDITFALPLSVGTATYNVYATLEAL